MEEKKLGRPRTAPPQPWEQMASTWNINASRTVAASTQQQPAVTITPVPTVQPTVPPAFAGQERLVQPAQALGMPRASGALSTQPASSPLDPTAAAAAASQLGGITGQAPVRQEEHNDLATLASVSAVAVPSPPAQPAQSAQPVLEALLNGLPDRPQIIKSLGPEYSQYFTFEELADIIPRRWHTLTDMGDIDLTTGTKHQPKVDVLAAMLLSKEQLDFASDVATYLRVNTHAAVGAYQSGYRSSTHCHILPVINFLFHGRKSWKVWKPGTFKLKPERMPPIDTPVPVTDTIPQNAGDVLWLPPGWVHQVTTLGGEMINKKVMSAGFAVWCVPAPFRALTYSRYITGEAVEQQKPERQSGKRKAGEPEPLGPEAREALIKELLAVPGNV